MGSLIKLWPWQAVVAYQIRPDGTSYPLEQEAVWPHMYTALTGGEPQTLVSGLMMIAGGVLVLAVHVLSRRLDAGEES